jgi:hypothetical protein
MEISLLHQSSLAQLNHDLHDNLDLYRDGHFNFLEEDETLTFTLSESIQLDLEALEPLLKFDGRGKTAPEIASTDTEFSSILFKSISSMEPSLARDPRLWTFLSHTYFLNYLRNRYPLPKDDDKALKIIKAHYFCTEEKRSVERNNGVSRLWWMAFVVSKVDELQLDDSLKAFLATTDIRANIFERPSTSQNTNVLTGILKVISNAITEQDPIIERKNFREFMKQINIWGGYMLIGDLEQNEIDEKLQELRLKVLTAT